MRIHSNQERYKMRAGMKQHDRPQGGKVRGGAKTEESLSQNKVFQIKLDTREGEGGRWLTLGHF